MKLETVDLTIVQDLVIVKLYKPRTFKQTQQVLDDEKNKGKDPKKDIMAMKTVETKVRYNFQTVIILAIKPNNGVGLEAGDVCLVDFRKLREFDLQKDTYITNVYELLAKVTDA